MSVNDITLKKAKNGFIVSYWKSAPKTKGQPGSCCGMGEHIDEVFTDKTKASERMSEIVPHWRRRESIARTLPPPQ
tara:strand:+ start:1158 stop:1385 length:228 start_codon:yes stop_codon:yes gene_type:complete